MSSKSWTPEEEVPGSHAVWGRGLGPKVGRLL